MAELNSTKYIDNLLLECVENNDATGVVKLVESGANINQKVIKKSHAIFEYTTTLLHIAAEKNSALICKYLISKGIDPNIKDSIGNTSLYNAIRGKSVKSADVLLKAGCKIDKSENLDYNNFYQALYKGRYKIANLMLEYDNSLAKMVFESDNSNNPFHVIAFHSLGTVGKDIKVLTKSLVKYGADINHKDDYGSTPLHHSAHYFNEYTETLLKNGACPNIKNWKGETPLHISAHACTPVSAKALVKHGADLHAEDKYGSIPLFYAGGPVKQILIYSKNHKENPRCRTENTK